MRKNDLKKQRLSTRRDKKTPLNVMHPMCFTAYFITREFKSMSLKVNYDVQHDLYNTLEQ